MNKVRNFRNAVKTLLGNLWNVILDLMKPNTKHWFYMQTLILRLTDFGKKL